MGELLFKTHGKRKKGQTLKPGTKAKSNKAGCGICGPDIWSFTVFNFIYYFNIKLN